MKEIPETYIKAALYGSYYFLKDHMLMSCPIKADGEPDVESIGPVDMSNLDDDAYDHIWNIGITLEDVEE